MAESKLLDDEHSRHNDVSAEKVQSQSHIRLPSVCRALIGSLAICSGVDQQKPGPHSQVSNICGIRLCFKQLLLVLRIPAARLRLDRLDPAEQPHQAGVPSYTGARSTDNSHSQ